MDLPSKAEIVAALPSLAKEELEAIQALVGHLLGNQTNEASPVALTVFNALAAVTGAAMPLAALPASLGQRFKTKLPFLIEFLDKNFETWEANRTVQLAFLRMLFTLLSDDLKKRRVTPTLGIMINNLNRVQEVFESQFPSYLDSGLGGLILKKFK